MKFFVPHRENREDAERFYRLLRGAAKARGHELTYRRVYSIAFTRDSKLHSATVGGLDTPSEQQCIAIFEHQPGGALFVIYTLDTLEEGYGVLAGGPLSVEDFEAEDEPRKIV